jgi:hypothetical protein
MTTLPRPGLASALCALCTLGFVCVPVRASTPTDRLLRLVPEDITFCATVTDLRGHSAKLQSAAWYRRLVDSPLVRTLVSSPEFKQVAKLDEHLRQHLGTSLVELRDDILGDAVVLAYRAGPPGKPEQERGLLLLWARDGDRLVRLVERLNEVQKQSGELKAVEERRHKGTRYHRRVEPKADHFYLVRGPLLAFSATEEMLREVIDRLPAEGVKKKPAAGNRRLLEMGASKALLAVWVNPRAFDAELRKQAAQPQGPNAQVLQTFIEYWKGLDGLGLTLSFEPEPELRLLAQGRPEAFPASFRRLIEACSRPSDAWGRFPDDSLLTVAGRLHASEAYKVLGQFLTAEQREELRTSLQRNLGAPLGMDFVEDVLPYLGPDWGACLAPSPEPGELPHALFALRVHPGPKEAPVDQSVFKAMQFFAGLAVWNYNHKPPLRVKGVIQGKVEVKYLAGEKAFPPGVQPAFALKDGYLVLASSPAAVLRFGPTRPAGKGDVPLLRLSSRELSVLLQARRQQLIDYLAERQGTSRDAAGQWLDGVVSALGLFDRVELSQRSEPGQVTWALRFYGPRGRD